MLAAFLKERISLWPAILALLAAPIAFTPSVAYSQYTYDLYDYDYDADFDEDDYYYDDNYADDDFDELEDGYAYDGDDDWDAMFDDVDAWWEDNPYYSEDEWFDPTDWFDGNNYEYEADAYAEYWDEYGNDDY